MSALFEGREVNQSVDLSRYEHTYELGRSWLVRVAWFFGGSPLVRSQLLPSSAIRRGILRLFGAEIGTGVVIKPGVKIKFPWLLKVGDYSWIGEDCWIDNLALVVLGKNVCLSQAAYVCTGNHDWNDPQFALIVRPVRILDGAWVGARSVIAPGAVIGESSVVAMGSAVSARGIPAGEVHGGNPTAFLSKRYRETPEATSEQHA
jgi:putative colanic acid biosynthesis acetyltransferase WcaF